VLGAIAGDMIGSPYEARRMDHVDFPLFRRASRFTDDTVLTVALADSLLSNTPYTVLLKAYCRRYPDAGYGGAFIQWAASFDARPYGSWGNGSAMRVSPVAWAYDALHDVIAHAGESAAVTHDHAEGIRGAQALAAAIFLARTGSDKAAIRHAIERDFHYDLAATVADYRADYRFDVSCLVTVPQAITAFLESTDFEDAIRKAISIGGDCDTLACMAGSIAEAHYGGVPESILAEVYARLDAPLIEVVQEFCARFRCGRPQKRSF
jgi:ADP-ribosylglycohydrolase